MLTIANKGRYVLKKCQKHVYVICEGSLRVRWVVEFLTQEFEIENKHNF